MAKVWLVIDGQFSDQTPDSIWTDQARAEARATELVSQGKYAHSSVCELEIDVADAFSFNQTRFWSQSDRPDKRDVDEE